MSRRPEVVDWAATSAPEVSRVTAITDSAAHIFTAESDRRAKIAPHGVVALGPNRLLDRVLMRTLPGLAPAFTGSRAGLPAD